MKDHEMGNDSWSDVEKWARDNADVIGDLPLRHAANCLFPLTGKALVIEANRLRRGTRYKDKNGIRPRGAPSPTKYAKWKPNT